MGASAWTTNAICPQWQLPSYCMAHLPAGKGHGNPMARAHARRQRLCSAIVHSTGSPMRQHLLALALIAALGGCQQADAPTAPAGTAATAPAADAAVDAAFADLSKRALDT